MVDQQYMKPCCGKPLIGPHKPGCDFEPRQENPIDYGQLFVAPPDPEVSITLTRQLNAGIAAQLRALADLLDPPKGT
jgi:hypothetical protein